MAHIVFIALGTNIGDRQANLQAAIEFLEPEVHLLACSPIYETPPWGYEAQPSFLNQVIKANTDLTVQELLIYLKSIEAKLGLKETFRNGPRLIDLDILFYDDIVLDSPPLTIPHPSLQDRAFVLVPLAEIAPELLHPVLGVSVQELLAGVDINGIKRFSPSGCNEEI